jgi:hypothetical protein
MGKRGEREGRGGEGMYRSAPPFFLDTPLIPRIFSRSLRHYKIFYGVVPGPPPPFNGKKRREELRKGRDWDGRGARTLKRIGRG